MMNGYNDINSNIDSLRWSSILPQSVIDPLKILSTTIGLELTPVSPMGEPKADLYWMDPADYSDVVYEETVVDDSGY